MEQKIYRAKTIKKNGHYEALIYVSGLWRLFGTPYNVTLDELKPYKEDRIAKRGAEVVAVELGIKLEWEAE